LIPIILGVVEQENRAMAGASGRRLVFGGFKTNNSLRRGIDGERPLFA
jgi:hypothetical protein